MSAERKCLACGGDLLVGQFVHGPKIVLHTRAATPLPVLGEVCERCGRVEVRVERLDDLRAQVHPEHDVQESDF